MPWVGDEFVLLYDFEADRNLGPPTSRISATKVMETLRDFALGLQESLNVHGTNPPLEDYDWNGKRITNAGDATAPTDLIPAGQVSLATYAGTLTESSDVNTLSATLALAPTSIPAGHQFTARFANANTSAMTLSVNVGTRLDLLDRAGNALVSGDVIADCFHTISYDGTAYRIMTPIASELVANPDGVGIYNVASPLTGNGTSTTLDISFSSLSAGDVQTIATKIMADGTAAATIVGGLPSAPARLTCSSVAPTGSDAILGCFWFRLPELILYARVRDEADTTIWMDISTPNGGAANGPNTVSTGSIQANAVTNAKLATMAANTIKGNTSASTAAVTDLTAAQANLLLNDGAATVTTATATGTYTPDMSAGMLHDMTVTGTLLIAAPTSPLIGQVIIFRLQQDATGSRTISWNAAYNFGAAGAPVLSTSAGDADYVVGVVRSVSNVEILSVVTGF